MARTKKNTRKSKKQIEQEEEEKNQFIVEIKGIIFFAIGFLLLISIYTNLAGFLSNITQKITYLLLGIGSFVIPLYVLFLAYSYLKGRGNINISRKFVGITMLIVVLILIFSTVYIEALEKPGSYVYNFRMIAKSSIAGEKGIHGGIIAYSISYLFYKLIGGVGSFILYGAIGVISLIVAFKVSIFDISSKAKEKTKMYKSQKRSRHDKIDKDDDEPKKNDTFINIEQFDDDNDTKDNKEYLEGVNHKIKILDFMKNNELEDEEITDYKQIEDNKQTDFDLEKEILDKQVKENKKTKLDDNIKDEVHEEIESKISGENDNEEKKEYIFPNTNLLNNNGKTKLNSDDKKELIDSANKLEETLSSFGVEAKVVQVTKGPSVTRFELQPSPGVKVSKIVNLADDIALGLAASGVRIEAPIPGKAAIGIEVPNRKQTAVFLREVLDSKEFKNTKNKLAFALGKDIAGQCVVGDLSKMPHTLIAGATGSGKSVCINSLIISILYKYKPEEVKLLMVDPKVVELNVYNGIPHLLIPVVTDPKKAAAALNWAVNEMTKRYNLFAENGVRNMESYNGLYDKGLISEKLPYIIIIVDELADLMMVCPNDVEDYIGRLAQMARAAGMHLVIATQRPSVDVITGVIKANIPSRISFAVSSQVDSRTILDSAGAEKLLGKGDMLYYPVGESKPQRVQGCFISEEEVESVVKFIKEDKTETLYEESILEHINNETSNSNSGDENNDVDELLNQAIELVVDYEQASTSFLQRRLRIGFNRASRIMEQLEERNIISPRDGSKPRKVLISKNDLSDNDDENEN